MRLASTQLIPIPQVPAQGPLSSVPVATQTRTNWCWAACVEMVKRHLGDPISQCAIVEQFFNRPANTCCDDPEGCNSAIDKDEIVNVFKDQNLKANFLGEKRLSFKDLKQLIDDSVEPVQIGWERPSNRHVVLVVHATEQDGGGEVCEVRDPQKGSGFIPFSELESAYGEGEWRWTWTELGAENGAH
jgi:Papain-like cysteine protease AvrRpt2